MQGYDSNDGYVSHNVLLGSVKCSMKAMMTMMIVLYTNVPSAVLDAV